MPKVLSEEQLLAFRRDGVVFPITILSPEEAAEMHRRFDELERRLDGEATKRLRIKAHLPFPWLTELIRHPRLTDAVEDLVGPDVVVWGSSFFAKKARDRRFVSWHQDSTYYGLEPPDSVNVWLAFSDSHIDNGCLRVLPGTHKGASILKHVETYAPDNILSRGQTIPDVDESQALDVELEPGQCSIHHDKLIHGSNPNPSDRARVGYAIHFAPAHVRQTLYEGATATVARGADRAGHWRADPIPERDFDPAGMAALEEALRRYRSHTARGS